MTLIMTADIKFKVACAVLLGAGPVLSGTWIVLRALAPSEQYLRRQLVISRRQNAVHTCAEKHFQTPRGKVKGVGTNTEPAWSCVREQVTETLLYSDNMIMALQASRTQRTWTSSPDVGRPVGVHVFYRADSLADSPATHCCWLAIRWGLSLWAAPPAPWGRSPPRGFSWTPAPGTASSLLPGASSHLASSLTSCKTREKRRRVKELRETRRGQ